jgi:pimeloyl-ACP methyl ester carboxylesterase
MDGRPTGGRGNRPDREVARHSALSWSATVPPVGPEQRRPESPLEPATWVTARDGTRVATYDFGGEGRDLILVHATGFCAAVLAPLAAQLTDSHRCWAIDLRAHGRSEPPSHADFRWSGFADDVTAAIEQLGLEHPSAFGHSCGGAAVLLAEEARPGTFAALYCFEPVILRQELPAAAFEQNPLSVGARRRRSTFPSAEDAFVNFSAKPPFSVLDPEVLRLYVEEGLEVVPERDGGDGRAVRLRCRREDEAAVYAHSASHGAFAGLSVVACPVTLACGAQTDSFGPPILEAEAARLRRARVEVLPGLGHFGPLEDPVAVGRSVHRAFPGSETPGP